MKLYPVLLAGGKGTRFWPRSRQNKPKQFLRFGSSSKTLFEQTFDRVNGLPFVGSIAVVADVAYASTIRALSTSFDPGMIFLEPEGRNTGPAAVWAAMNILRKTGDQDAIMLAMACDNAVEPISLFQQAIADAFEYCQTTQAFVLFGIRPTRPETGYGYIDTATSADRFKPVLRFIEKPPCETAAALLQKTSVYWNSGMFMWPIKRFLAEFKRLAPASYQCLERAAAAIGTPDAYHVLESEYKSLASDSIDHAVMERTPENLTVLPVTFQWSDLGDLSSTRMFLNLDSDDNATSAKRTFLKDSRRNTIDCPTKAVAAIGIEDLVIIDTPDVLLLAPNDRLQEIKDLVAQIQSQSGEDLL